MSWNHIGSVNGRFLSICYESYGRIGGRRVTCNCWQLSCCPLLTAVHFLENMKTFGFDSIQWISYTATFWAAKKCTYNLGHYHSMSITETTTVYLELYLLITCLFKSAICPNADHNSPLLPQIQKFVNWTIRIKIYLALLIKCLADVRLLSTHGWIDRKNAFQNTVVQYMGLI